MHQAGTAALDAGGAAEEGIQGKHSAWCQAGGEAGTKQEQSRNKAGTKQEQSRGAGKKAAVSAQNII